jgi:hypothetical protein
VTGRFAYFQALGGSLYGLGNVKMSVGEIHTGDAGFWRTWRNISLIKIQLTRFGGRGQQSLTNN